MGFNKKSSSKTFKKKKKKSSSKYMTNFDFYTLQPKDLTSYNLSREGYVTQSFKKFANKMKSNIVTFLASYISCFS